MPKVGQVIEDVVDIAGDGSEPFWQTTDEETVRLYLGDVREQLMALPAKSVHCVVTSPPYWGLRDYGTGTWEGGNPKCKHQVKSIYQDNSKHDERAKIRDDDAGVFARPSGWEGSRRSVSGPASTVCPKCGARRIDRQLGSEALSDCLAWARGENCADETRWSGGVIGCQHEPEDILIPGTQSSESSRGPTPKERLNSPDGYTPVAGWTTRDRTVRKVVQGDAWSVRCRKCSAVRGSWALGCHVCRMVLVFREVRRVLRDDGTLWLNYGDSYSTGGAAGNNRNGTPDSSKHRVNQGHRGTVPEQKPGYKQPFRGGKGGTSPYLEQGKMTGGSSGLPAGNLVGIPWRVALALQADGWVLRQDIVWHKPGPMPESVRNRCTKAHEYVFLLTKKREYFYDAEAIREQNKEGTGDLTGPNKRSVWHVEDMALLNWITENEPAVLARFLSEATNKKDVWSIQTHGYAGAHFATFPEKLIEPCILAGTSERGACAECGTPWRRIVERGGGTTGMGSWCEGADTDVSGASRTPLKNEMDEGDYFAKTVGWQPTCECHGKLIKREGTRLGYGSYHAHEADGVEYGLRQDVDGQSRGPASNPGAPTKVLKASWVEYVSDLPLEDHPTVPCTVLDPFIGSGTACVVALRYKLRSIGIDLSESYLKENAIPRIRGALLSRPVTARLAGTTKTAPVTLGSRANVT